MCLRWNKKYSLFVNQAPIAQLDRAMVCGTIGQRFESSWAHFLSRKNSRREVISKIAGIFSIGEVAERFKAHAWKACVGLNPTEGSNPSLSV